MKLERKPYGILTYHDGYNFGAYLQVYALQQFLISQGLRTEIIDYKNLRHWYNEYKNLFRTKSPKLFIQNLLKLIAFKREHRRLVRSDFSTNSKSFSGLNYKAIIYGSDEIWNYKNPVIGLDSFYFGIGLNGVRKIAYAPSCGTLPSDAIVPEDIIRGWQSFDLISVRDINSQSILSRFRQEIPPIVLDPTFLYDFGKETQSCDERNFVLVYTTGLKKAEENALRNFAERHGKKLISIGYRNNFCDKSVIGVSPFEFLGYFDAADYIVTSMFHGTIFAIKAQKNFAILVDPYRTNKLAYILKKLNIRDRVTDAVGLEGVLNSTVDYATINEMLQEQIQQSKAFLLDALT